MWAIVSNNTVDRVIRTPVQITVGGVTYPRNIFTKWSKPDLAALGILPYMENKVDARYYWTGNVSYSISDTAVVGNYTGSDRDLDGLKEGLLSRVKQQAASKLAATDWMVIREADGGKAVSQEVRDYRAGIRTTSDLLEGEINGIQTLADFIAYDNKQFKEVRKVKHTSEDGVETYGPETEESIRTISGADARWPVDPLAKVDPAFVSLTEVV
jgi:hypothetical protein